jgi:hypothetical protein
VTHLSVKRPQPLGDLAHRRPRRVHPNPLFQQAFSFTHVGRGLAKIFVQAEDARSSKDDEVALKVFDRALKLHAPFRSRLSIRGLDQMFA